MRAGLLLRQHSRLQRGWGKDGALPDISAHVNTAPATTAVAFVPINTASATVAVFACVTTVPATTAVAYVHINTAPATIAVFKNH